MSFQVPSNPNHPGILRCCEIPRVEALQNGSNLHLLVWEISQSPVLQLLNSSALMGQI